MGHDGREAGATRPLGWASSGREPSDAAVVGKQGAAHRGAAAAGGITTIARQSETCIQKEGRDGEGSRKSLREEVGIVWSGTGTAIAGTLGGQW